MDKDLYIELLEKRIRAGGNQPAWDPVLLRTQIRNVNEKYQRAEMDLQNRDEEIQDLKLENDRLKQRDEIILPFINSLACQYTSLDCDDCIYHSINGCKFSDLYSGSPICKEAESILKKLEDL